MRVREKEIEIVLVVTESGCIWVSVCALALLGRTFGMSVKM